MTLSSGGGARKDKPIRSEVRMMHEYSPQKTLQSNETQTAERAAEARQPNGSAMMEDY